MTTTITITNWKDYDLDYEEPLSRSARLSFGGVPGRTRASAHARLSTWLDASTDAMCPVLTGAFVVPIISTQSRDGRAAYTWGMTEGCGIDHTAWRLVYKCTLTYMGGG